MDFLTNKTYDFLIVGAGLFGATFARLATDAGYKCLVIDRRPHTGGNTYCQDISGIGVQIGRASCRERV